VFSDVFADAEVNCWEKLSAELVGKKLELSFLWRPICYHGNRQLVRLSHKQICQLFARLFIKASQLIPKQRLKFLFYLQLPKSTSTNLSPWSFHCTGRDADLLHHILLLQIYRRYRSSRHLRQQVHPSPMSQLWYLFEFACMKARATIHSTPPTWTNLRKY
jgi:hypothetical protein